MFTRNINTRIKKDEQLKDFDPLWIYIELLKNVSKVVHNSLPCVSFILQETLNSSLEENV